MRGLGWALAWLTCTIPAAGLEITISTRRPARAFLAGEEVKLALRLGGEQKPETVTVTVQNALAEEIVAQEIAVDAQGEASFEHGELPLGYYSLRVTAEGEDGAYQDALVVLPHVRRLPPGEPSMFGVEAGGALGEDDFEAMAQCGIRWVRCDAFAWPSIEPRADEYDWAEADNAVEQAEKHGLRLIGLLGYATPWNAVTPRDADNDQERAWHASPYRSHAEWDRAVQELFQRYGDSVSLWELWHEADGAFYLGTWDRYLETLKLTTSRLRRASPEARMIHGGSCGAWNLMEWTAKATEGAYFDYQNGHYPFHGYGEGRGLEPPQGYRTTSPQVAQLHGLPQPLLVTEASRGFGSKDHTEVAAELARLLIQAAAVRCPLWCWYTWEGTDGPCLVERRGDQLVPRPAYAAYANVVHHLGGAHFLGRVRSFGSNVKGYLLADNGAPILVVWRLEGRGIELAPDLVAAREDAATDFLGSPVDTAPRGRLPVGREPLFVTIEPDAAVAVLSEALHDSLDRLLNTKIGQPRALEEGGSAWGLQPLRYGGVFRDDLEASCGTQAVARAQNLALRTTQALGNAQADGAAVCLRELRDACLEWGATVAQKIAVREPLRQQRKIPRLPLRPGRKPEAPDPRRWGGPTTGYPRGVEWLRRLLMAAHQCNDMAIGLQDLAQHLPRASEADLAAASQKLEALQEKLDQGGGPYARLVRTEVLLNTVEDWCAEARATRDPDLLALVGGAIGVLDTLAEAEPPLVTKVFFTVEMPTAEQLVRQRRLSGGREHPLIITVWNFAGQPVSGTLGVQAPTGWELSGVPPHFQVPAHDHTAGLRLLVKLPANASGGRITLSGTLDSGEALPPFWYVLNQEPG